MGCEQNLQESSMDMISLLTICMNLEILEWQFLSFLVKWSEKYVTFIVILHEITEVMWNGCVWEFATKNWKETWFRDMLKIAFELEFSENMISLTLHKCKCCAIFWGVSMHFAGILVSNCFVFSDTNTLQLRTDEHGDCWTWHSELRTSCGFCSFNQLWLERWQDTLPSYWISSYNIWYALFLDFYLVNSFYR